MNPSSPILVLESKSRRHIRFDAEAAELSVLLRSLDLEFLLNSKGFFQCFDKVCRVGWQWGGWIDWIGWKTG